MTLPQTVVFAFGIFTAIGGAIGYFKAKSKASIIAGGVFGIMLLFCANGIGNGNTQSYYVALLVSLILGFRFFKTWRTKKKVMPDLIMVIFSAVSTAVILWGLFQ